MVDLLQLMPDIVTFLNSLGIFLLAVKKARQ